uniref:Uncharacterized protein n=1 Tax=Amphimedon queenslandica TaxID=400682 RepID=A0A1X7SU02_AMPQE
MPKHSSLQQKLDLTDKTLVFQHIIEILYDGLLILCSNPSSDSEFNMKELGSLCYKMENIVDLTVLIDTVVFITFKKENVLDLLYDQTYYPVLPFYSIIETIINHYIAFFYDDITLETTAYIFSIIGLVVSGIDSNAKLEASVKMDDDNNPLLLFTNKVRNGLCHAINERYRVPYFKCCPKMISQSKGLLQHVLCDMYFEASSDRLYRESHKFKELVSHHQKLNGYTAGPLSTIVDVERQVVVHVTIKALSITILKTENERQV